MEGEIEKLRTVKSTADKSPISPSLIRNRGEIPVGRHIEYNCEIDWLFIIEFSGKIAKDHRENYRKRDISALRSA